MKDLLSGRDILFHLQKLIMGILHFPSESLLSVSSLSQWYLNSNVWFKIKKTMRSLPVSQLCSDDGKCSGGGGGGVSFTSPLTSCLSLDPAPTSFQQRIKQLLTEEWRDWQVKVSFLVRRASVSVWPMSSQNSHFTFQRDLNNFWISLLWNTREVSGAPLFTLFV